MIYIGQMTQALHTFLNAYFPHKSRIESAQSIVSLHSNNRPVDSRLRVSPSLPFLSRSLSFSAVSLILSISRRLPISLSTLSYCLHLAHSHSLTWAEWASSSRALWQTTEMPRPKTTKKVRLSPYCFCLFIIWVNWQSIDGSDAHVSRLWRHYKCGSSRIGHLPCLYRVLSVNLIMFSQFPHSYTAEVVREWRRNEAIDWK